MTKTQMQALIAAFIRGRRATSEQRRIGYDWAVADFAAAMAEARKGFDATRFLKDCGVTP